jgi:hypothetical protein
MRIKESAAMPSGRSAWGLQCSMESYETRILVRDQEVEDSNPFAPTTSFQSHIHTFCFFVRIGVDDFVESRVCAIHHAK